MDVTTSNAVSTVQSVSISLSQTWKLETCPKILTSWLIDKLPSSKNILDKNLIKVFILFVNKQKIQDTTALHWHFLALRKSGFKYLPCFPLDLM